jgi:hypothetical protein
VDPLGPAGRASTGGREWRCVEGRWAALGALKPLFGAQRALRELGNSRLAGESLAPNLPDFTTICPSERDRWDQTRLAGSTF